MSTHVIGWDPGAHLGWVHLEMLSRPRYVDGGTIDVGRQIERISRGKARMVRDVSDADLDVAMAQVTLVIADAMATHDRLVLGISRVRRMHPTARHEARTGQSIGLSIGTGIADAQWIGGEIRGRAKAMGITHVLTVEEARWRQDICGAARPQRGVSADRWISKIVPARIDGWPRISNPHMRDAAGVAEWVGTVLQYLGER